MLQELKGYSLFRDVSIMGLASTHPVACDVMAKMGGKPISLLNTL